jgi:carbonic anhydrase
MNSLISVKNLRQDLPAGLVTFLVALPLCLGIALASGAPLFSGILAGVIGGVVVGTLSGSHTSVSGPAAGLAAIVVAQLDALGSFEVSSPSFSPESSSWEWECSRLVPWRHSSLQP